MTRHWTDNFRSPAAVSLFLGTAVIGLALDLWTKALAVEHLKDGPTRRFIAGWLHFTYTENHGAVFGIAQGARTMFLIVSIGAIGFLLFLFLTSGRSRVQQFILGLLMAGVIGNLYDRVVHGHVRDMLYALPGWHWPPWLVAMFPQRWQPMPGQQLEVFPWIFNLADSYLCVGVAGMLVYSFVAEYRRKRVGAAAEKVGGKDASEPNPPRLDPSAERT